MHQHDYSTIFLYRPGWRIHASAIFFCGDTRLYCTSLPYLSCILIFDMYWTYDTVIKRKHFPRYWPGHRWIPLTKPVTRTLDVFFDLNKRFCVNNRKAGDLRRHCFHYDVTVMNFHVHSNYILLYCSPQSFYFVLILVKLGWSQWHGPRLQ